MSFVISIAFGALGGILGILLLFFAGGKIFWAREEKKTIWKILRIRPNIMSERNPSVAEYLFSALHGLFREHNIFEKLTGKPQVRFAFEIAVEQGKISFFARIPEHFSDLLESQIYANYPEAEIEESADYFPQNASEIAWAELDLINSNLWPIKRYSQFEDALSRVLNDPIAGLTLPFSRLSGESVAAIQMACRPFDMGIFRRRAVRCLNILERNYYRSHFLKEGFQRAFLRMGFWRRFFSLPARFFFWIMRGGNSGGNSVTLASQEVEMEMSRRHDRENETTAASDKVSRILFETTIRIFSFSPGENFKKSAEKVRETAGAFQPFHTPQLNGFQLSRIQKTVPLLRQRFENAVISRETILSAEELATIFHLPNKTVSTPRLDWVSFKKIEPPLTLPLDRETDITLLGKTNFRGRNEVFGIRPDDRRRHIYIVGKTGMGKSTLLENMIASDIRGGKGLAVVDPHGDLTEALLRFVPKNRTNDVILFDPADRDFPISFNVLECPNPEQRHLVASGVVGVFKKIFAESWGPRLEHILRNTLLALIEAEGQTLLGVMRMLADAKFREEILARVSDPLVRSFWKDEFGKWQPKQVSEAVAPIQNKVGQFLSSSLVRNILGQVKSTLDLRFAMDKGKIILVNLSKGKIGEDTSALLGSFLITKFQLEVMSRADTAEKDRRDFALYVDEFQNFATDSFATILSEARKYRLSLTVANQYLAQMSEEVRDAIFGNVGTTIAFQVGFEDAEKLSEQFGGEEKILASDIGTLPKYHAYLRLMIDGTTSSVFSAKTLPPPEVEEDESRIEKIRNVSRERYGKPRKTVEEKIMKWAWSER